MTTLGRTVTALGRKAFGSTQALLIITTTIVFMAAFIKMAVGTASDNGWAWITFFQDLTQNFFIAVVIVYVTAALTDYREKIRIRREQGNFVIKRIETIAILMRLPEDPGTEEDLITDPPNSNIVTLLHRKAEMWGDLAAALKEWMTRGPLEESKSRDGGRFATARDGMQSLLDDVASLALSRVKSNINFAYSANGERQQRATYLTFLVDDLATITTTSESDLAQEAQKCRELAIRFSASTRYTDAMVENYLVFDRLSSPDKDMNAVFGLYPGDLHELTRATDSVALLFTFCDRVLGVIDSEPRYSQLAKALYRSANTSFEALELELQFGQLLAEGLATLLVKAAKTVGAGQTIL